MPGIARTTGHGRTRMLPELVALTSARSRAICVLPRGPRRQRRARDDARRGGHHSRAGCTHPARRAALSTRRARAASSCPTTKKTCTWRSRPRSARASGAGGARSTRRARATIRSRSTCGSTCASAARRCSRASPRSLGAARRSRREREADVSFRRTRIASARSPSSAAFLRLRVGDGARFARPTCSRSRSTAPTTAARVGRVLGDVAADRSRARRAAPRLLAASRRNALDTVDDRDFALDFVVGVRARVILASRADRRRRRRLLDGEFALVKLDGEIAAGSSMMPQKKNPDVFELVRGKSARGVGDVMAMLALVNGLAERLQPRPTRRPRAAPRGAARARARSTSLDARAAARALRRARAASAMLDDGFTQATDLAEALVRKGVPFREAYGASAQLVRRASTRASPLARRRRRRRAIRALCNRRDARSPCSTPRAAVAAKESPGGTGPRSVAAQIATIRARGGRPRGRSARRSPAPRRARRARRRRALTGHDAPMTERDFLTLTDLTLAEAREVLELATKMKREPKARAHRSSSRGARWPSSSRRRARARACRSRSASRSSAMHPVVLGAQGSQLGRGEPIARHGARARRATATLIVFRTSPRRALLEMAQRATVPVINALSDDGHPVQVAVRRLHDRGAASADRRIEGKRVAFVGDGASNMARSLVEAATLFGFELVLAGPRGLHAATPTSGARRRARHADARSAATRSSARDVVNTDVWTSMGQEAESDERTRRVRGVDA